MTRRIHRLRALLGIGVVHFRREQTRSVLAILGVTLAVLSTTLLASVGFGVLATGQEKFDAADRDLWITGGPMRLAPGSVGGFENSILDAHRLDAELEAHPAVDTAVPLAFQTVYVGRDPNELKTIVGVGVPGTGGPSVRITNGRGFSRSRHYADGTYSGPMSKAVVIDRRTARLFDVDVGDSLYVGGTVASARRNRVTVVGISPTFSRFLGTPTVTMPLAELQTLTDSARSDRATLVTVSLVDGASAQRVERELTRRYPSLDVRTNREQLRAVVADKALVLAAGGTLVVLSVVAGITLTINLLSLIVFQKRAELAAARAIGISSRSLACLVGFHGVAIGLVGGGLGLGLTVPLGEFLNVVAAELVGFNGLVRTPPSVFLVGAGIAILIGGISAAFAGWRAAKIPPLSQLDS